jgi:hypothetical protein
MLNANTKERYRLCNTYDEEPMLTVTEEQEERNASGRKLGTEMEK